MFSLVDVSGGTYELKVTDCVGGSALAGLTFPEREVTFSPARPAAPERWAPLAAPLGIIALVISTVALAGAAGIWYLSRSS